MAGFDSVTDSWIADFNAMRQERRLIDPFYQAASYYFDPLSAHVWAIEGGAFEGIKWNGDVFTGAGISANNRLSTFLMGNGTPPTAKWLNLSDANQDLMKQDDVAQFWADSTRVLETDMRGLPGRQSSFYIAMRDAYRNMGLSYGVVHVGEYKIAGRPTGTVFYEAVSPASCWFRFGAHGEITAFAYLRNMTNEQAKGFMDRNAVKNVQGFTHTDAPGKTRQVLQMVKINYDADPVPKAARDYPYQERWIDLGEGKTMLETGHRSQPFHVIGWNKIPGSNYFVGPAYDALPDLTGASAARKAQLQAMAWQGRPPLLAGTKDGFDNPSRTLVPGRITFGAVNHEGKAMVQALNTGMNSGIFQYAVSEDEARVREMMMGNELVSQRRPNMTAAEVMQIAQERAQMVAPFMITTMPGLKGMIARHFELRLRLGGLPPVPRAVASEGQLDADINGPMAIAARQSEVGNVFNMLEQINYLAQIDPAAARRINTEEVTNLMGHANGTIALLHSWEKVQKDMKAEAEANAQMAEAQIGQMQAGAAKDEAQAVKAVMQ